MFWFSAKPSTFNDLPRLPEKIRSVLKMKKKELCGRLYPFSSSQSSEKKPPLSENIHGQNF